MDGLIPHRDHALMAKYYSITARTAFNAPAAEEVGVVLAKVTHPDLDEPVYLSSDPTERLSTDPLIYGTRRSGQDWLFVFMGAMVPDDQKDVPPRASLVFDNVRREIVDQLRSIITPVSVDLTVVLASDPENVEAQYTDLKGVKAGGEANQITLEISREPFTDEPWPSGRMTWERFPGLHR